MTLFAIEARRFDIGLGGLREFAAGQADHVHHGTGHFDVIEFWGATLGRHHANTGQGASYQIVVTFGDQRFSGLGVASFG